jgi:Mg-chelatase subunit ChlD
VKDGGLPALARPLLEAPREQFDLMAAAVRAFERLHLREGIEPLIAFLGREDKAIGRLRTDATAALRSLTGQTFGPYRDPWEGWWKEAQATFQMPAEPKPRNVVEGQEKGVTFYGIRTFSDRILLILDVSLSMEKPDAKGKPEPRRIDVAKKELTGAIHNVDDGHRFNVVLFNHSVSPWQPGMLVASEDTRRKAAKWVEEAEHIGGTNIHDALESAFMLALRATGEPIVDTVFFVTDGTPTAGKLQDPKAILDQAREWNRQANLTLHCIALGEADHEFLQELAKIGNGTFLRR